MKRSTFVAALFATSALASPAVAQQYSPPGIPPIRETIDANGVDLTRGVWVGSTHTVSIGGPGAAGMSWSRTIVSDGSFRDSTAIILSISGSSYTMSVGGGSESFTLTGSDYVSDQKTGSTLSLSGTTYTYTTSDGTVYTLMPYTAQKKQYRGNDRVSTVTFPTGEVLTFNWEVVDGICIPNIHAPDNCNWVDGERLRSVTATNGYRLAFTFEVEAPAGTGAGWGTIATVSAQNMSVDPASQSWPTLTFTGTRLDNTQTVADSLSRTTTYTFSGGMLTAVKRPGASTNNETLGYASGLVSSVLKDGVSTGYAYSTVGSVLTTTLIRAL
jgi:hypothetical protein